jgi:CheY-like chemotaxis protein
MLQPAGSGGAGGPRQDRGRIAMKVLYIEDNDDDVYMLTMRLELLGDFEILAAQNGEKGCEMAVSERPDIIIMDLEMPVMDGWEAARWLKSKPQTRDIPIIALSAHALSGERERAFAAGCDEFNVKPIQFERLLASLRHLGAGRQ